MSVFLVLAMMPSSLEGATEPCFPVEPRNADGNHIVPGTMGDIVYRRVEGVELAMDAYVQEGARQRPAVLVVHGGGWTSGSRVTYVSQFLELLARAGFNWFSVDYRLVPAHPFPAALDDLRAALEFIRCNAAVLGTDPDRIALLGEDSGAHLAALLAAEAPRGVRAVVTFGGPFDLTALTDLPVASKLEMLLGPRSEAEWAMALRRASPLFNLRAGMPPLLAFHGTADREIPSEQSRLYCRALLEQGGQCDLELVPGGIHAPENWTPEQWQYKKRLVEWLGEKLELGEVELQPYTEGRLKKNLEYGSYRDTEGKIEPLLVDAYVPDGPGPFPAVIVAHGGGWEAGDKVTYVTPVFEPLSKAGFAWFSIDYRLTPHYRHPQQLDDLRRAIRFVRHHSDRFRVDPERIATLGESASGQMVLQVASKPCPGVEEASDLVEREPCHVRAVVSFYGVYDFIPMVQDAAPRSLLVRLFGIDTLNEEARRVLREYSPYYQVHANIPPLLLIHGTNESLWKQAVQLSERLDQLNAPYQLLALEGAPHGMENWEGHPEWMFYKKQLLDWLKKQLAPGSDKSR